MKEKLELERKEKKTRLIQLRYIREIKYLLRVQYFNQTRLWWSLLRKKDRLIYCSNVILIKTANWCAINYNMLINVIFQRSSLIFSTRSNKILEYAQVNVFQLCSSISIAKKKKGGKTAAKVWSEKFQVSRYIISYAKHRYRLFSWI